MRFLDLMTMIWLLVKFVVDAAVIIHLWFRFKG